MCEEPTLLKEEARSLEIRNLQRYKAGGGPKMGKCGIAISILWLAFALSSGCSPEEQLQERAPGVTAEDVKEKAKQTYESAKLFTQEQLEDFQERTRQELEEYDDKLDRLTTRLEGLQAETKHELARKIRAVREKRDKAYAKLRELKSSSEEAWAEMKSGVETAMEELSKAYERAKDEFDADSE
jgi:hypothetical protein